MPRTGRPPKQPDEMLTARIDFRMLPEEKELFEKAADHASVKVSAWMRDRLKKTAHKELQRRGKRSS